MRKLFYLILTFALTVAPAVVFANGFTINEQGAKAIGMGGAFSAVADDPTAVYYNSAAITELDGIQMQIGIAPITPHATFTTPGGDKYHNDVKTFYIPSFYYTHKASENISYGVGVYSNFGLATAWKEDSPTRYLLGGREAYIESVTLNPVIAYRGSDTFSFSVGPFIRKVKANIESNFYFIGNNDADIKLKNLEDSAWGWTAAMHFRPTEKLSFGLTYKSQSVHTLAGESEFKSGALNPVDGGLIDGTNAAVLAAMDATYNQNISAKFILPAIWQAGVAYKPTEKFTVAFDIQRTDWSSYDKLESSELGLTKEKQWDDAYTFRLGAEYKLSDVYSLRAGIIRDMSPIPSETIDPMLPSGNRWLYALGFGADYGRFTVDFAYNYLVDDGGTFDNNAGYSGNPLDGGVQVTGEFDDVNAQIFQVNVGIRF